MYFLLFPSYSSCFLKTLPSSTTLLLTIRANKEKTEVIGLHLTNHLRKDGAGEAERYS